ncbi:Fic family protein [Candidatus Pacearchaeota archaeon]|nr:Fic family protein [Candidatus Pacearchaeota archaeon]
MRILKRKKGNEEYYYLQHSFRKGTKVITKEKYLGKEVPKNIEEIKDKLKLELQKELYKKLETIKKNFKEQWKRYPKIVKEKQLEEMSIAFTYNSNAIEGSTITEDEVREIIHDKIAPNKPLRDIKETEAHSKVFLEIIKQEHKITNNILLKWHNEIFSEIKQDIAGKIRDYNVRVGLYIAPDWQDLKDLMRDLIYLINKTTEINPVEFSAKVHYRFEKIHPFGDGNGRIGRLIMNHILWHAGYPIMIIEYKKRKSYYKALRGEEEDFIKYFIRRYLAVHKSSL